MSKRVFIHAGAQRTGTSSFQLCLYENRDYLNAAGFDLAYPGRDGVRDGRLRLQLPRKRHGAKRVPQFATRVRTHLARFSPDPARALILSEENIPGLMRNFYDGLFFPGSGNRLRTLAAALDDPPVHVLYVLRSYDELFASAFRKRAEDTAVPPFAEVAPRFLSVERGWPEIVAELRDLLAPQTLSVIPYERRGTSRDLLGRLVPELESDRLVEPARTVNLSVTDAGLEALQTRLHAGEKLSQSSFADLVATHAEDREPRGFARFSDADRAYLRGRYASDLDRVAAMDGLTFL